MKKLLFIALGAATLAGITSCSNEDEMLQLPSGEGQTFVINMPGELRGRSFGDGATASQLTYAVYDDRFAGSYQRGDSDLLRSHRYGEPQSG